MARLILRSNTARPAAVIELKPGINRFGRSHENTHCFPDPEISDQHCEVLFDNGFVFVRDLDSTNGTFVDGDPIRETAIYPGQVLRMGAIEMVLDAPQVIVAMPELPRPEQANAPVPAPLPDGHPACLNHETRHALWECPHCRRVFCDECIRKLGRAGGVQLKLCPSCSTPCKVTPWSEKMHNKKKTFFGILVNRVSDTIKRTTAQLTVRK
jgi:hypothetical protein